MNRIEMLKEMGITPVWVPRQVQAVASGAASAVPDARAAAPARALAPVVETAGTPAVVSAGAPAVGAAVASAVAPVSASTASRKPLVGAVPAGHAATTRSHSASAASALSKITADPERAALIARMDWPQLKQAVAGCQACTLCQSRTNTVFGTGDEQADWLIIGEAPGQEEDRLGEPFVGRPAICSTACWPRLTSTAAPRSTLPTHSSAARRPIAIPSRTRWRSARRIWCGRLS